MRITQPVGLVPVVLGFPAKDEAEDIEACLLALAAQQGASLDAVVLCVNNTTDDTAARARDLAPRLPFRLDVMEVILPPARAFAASARRMAMERAALLAGPDGILLTTDADSRAEPDWLALNLEAIQRGADAVAGRAEIEPVGATLIPEHLHAADALECAYAALLDEIASLTDPDPYDPWPRHDEHAGASIAVTVAAYHRAGGMPQVHLAEDRTFFDALRRVDARIRHEPTARVIVSARTTGRAPGGMADTMRRRMEASEVWLDGRLEPALNAVRRARLRARLRVIWPARPNLQPEQLSALARQLGLRIDGLATALSARWFGTAWSTVEATSPVLERQRVAVSALAGETASARRARDALRTMLTPPADPAGMPERAAAD